jgi:t-SNARE complex subunit (syntaxin)
MEGAVGELRTASAYQNSTAKKYMWIFIILLVILLVMIMVIQPWNWGRHY